MGSQPPRHKDKLPNCSTAAYWHRKAVVRGTTGVKPALLDYLRHRWCSHVGWVWLPAAEGIPRAGGAASGRLALPNWASCWVPFDPREDLSACVDCIRLVTLYH